MSERGRERLKTIAGGGGRVAPAAPSQSSVIAVRDLSLTFHTADGPVEALSHIELDVEPGAFVSLIGPSGCGKTTLLRVIADLEQPASGSILVNSLTPDEARRTRCYGYVFQAPALYPWRTSLRTCAAAGSDDCRPPSARRGQELRACQPHRLRAALPWQLSGGMAARVDRPRRSTRRCS